MIEPISISDDEQLENFENKIREFQEKVKNFVSLERYTEAFRAYYVLIEILVDQLTVIYNQDKKSDEKVEEKMKFLIPKGESLSEPFSQFFSWKAKRNQVIHEFKEISQKEFLKFEQDINEILPKLRDLINNTPQRQEISRNHALWKKYIPDIEDHINELNWSIKEYKLNPERAVQIKNIVTEIEQYRDEVNQIKNPSASIIKEIKVKIENLTSDSRQKMKEWRNTENNIQLSTLQATKAKLEANINAIEKEIKPWLEKEKLKELNDQKAELKKELLNTLKQIERHYSIIHRNVVKKLRR